jgi:hypothetical protein
VGIEGVEAIPRVAVNDRGHCVVGPSQPSAPWKNLHRGKLDRVAMDLGRFSV